MSKQAAKPRKAAGAKHPSGEDPKVIRCFLTSTPLREAPTTVVIEEKPESGESTGSGALNSGIAWNIHLAQLLHSMYLVTFTEKAQLGAMYSRNGGTVMEQPSTDGCTTAFRTARLSRSINAGSTTAAGAGDALRESAITVPVCSHSITVDARWLDAATRYCHLTVTLDDVARVAMVFPQLLQVRWSTEQPDQRTGVASSFANLSEQDTTGGSLGRANMLTGDATSTEQTNHLNIALPSSVSRLVARLYLCENHVISIEEAGQHLTQYLRTKGSPTAQRLWKALVNHHTAYAAYLNSLGGDGRGGGSGDENMRSTAPTTTTNTAGDITASQQGNPCPVKEAEGHVENKVDDEVLCASLSAELRASLSAPKLQALLRQMRKDAAHVEEVEQYRIAQRQLQERMLSAYEHIRSLYGPKDTRGRSAMALITAMQHESRFEDTLDIKALLSSLLAMSASGLSATMLREEHVVAEPVKPAEAKGLNMRGKRKREAEEKKSGADPLVTIHVMEPSLVSVTNLRHLTDAELELVLVRFDRTKGSVKGVLEATTYRAP